MYFRHAKRIRYCIAGVLLSVFVPPSISASGHTDTISYFDTRDVSAFYRDPGITAQAARFDLAAPAYLCRVSLWLSGEPGIASITIYGNEGAFAAPLLGTSLSQSIAVTKKKRGVEKITIELPEGIFIDRPQFFVVVSDLTPGVRWLSDKLERAPQCVAGADRWYYQAIQRGDGLWQAGKYAYAIEVVVDVPESFSPGYFADVTADAEFGDEILEDPTANASIAWADADGNGRYDVLVGGRLFANRGEDRFEDITDDANLPTGDIPAAHVFVDVDHDTDPDILWVGTADGAVDLLRNDGSGEFTTSTLDVASITHPTTISIADADANGHLDVFVGQGSRRGDSVLLSYMLFNAGDGKFTSTPMTALVPDDLAYISSRAIVAAQWIDADNDGTVDLNVTMVSDPAGLAETNLVLANDGTGRFTRASTAAPASRSVDGTSENGFGNIAVPPDWGDADGDGNPDLLQPISLTPQVVREATSGDGLLSEERIAAPGLLEDNAYEAFAGAGTWGDADNDGRLDALVTSACNCRFATLYLQERPGQAVDRSFEYGLFRIPAGNDAVWVDYNADGLLDLATFVDGRFRLFKNTLHDQNNHVGVDLAGDGNPAGSIGGTIEVHAGEKVWVRPIYSGRGALMQGPPTYHFGIGAADRIDSIVFRPVDGSEPIVLLDPEVNRVHKIFDDRAAQTSAFPAVSMSVSPNPFTTLLRFEYDLPVNAHVTLKIHSIDGTVLDVPVDESQSAGSHRIEWKPIDGAGEPLPAGTYIWRAVIGPRTFTGRAILAK